MSTTTRILLVFLLLLSAAMWFMLSKIEQRVRRQYLEAVEGPMVDTANLLASVLEPRVRDDGSIDLAEFRGAMQQSHRRRFQAQIYDVLKTSVNMHVYVTDARGWVLFDSRGVAEGQDYSGRRDVALTLKGRYGARSTRDHMKDSTSSISYVAAPIFHAGTIAGVVSVAKAHQDVVAFVSQTRSRIRLIGWSLFGVVALGAILATTIFSRPIQRLTQYARAVARGERVPAPRFSSPELATLGRALEEMREALEGRNYVASYVQTLTHEMKSPVSAIKGATELLREEMPPERRARFLANIEAESSRMQRIIDRLLALSEIESRKSLEVPEWIDLSAMASAICQQLQPAAEARGVRIEWSADEKPGVMGERFLLEIALTNLVQNALEFSSPGGAVRVCSTIEAAPAPAAVLIVEDSGPGVPEYALPHIFQRFYSLQHPATGRKSSGLGLCFVREAAELHGGTIKIENRQGSTGARAILRLPLKG